jgi:hypothetical protein
MVRIERLTLCLRVLVAVGAANNAQQDAQTSILRFLCHKIGKTAELSNPQAMVQTNLCSAIRPQLEDATIRRPPQKTRAVGRRGHRYE